MKVSRAKSGWNEVEILRTVSVRRLHLLPSHRQTPNNIYMFHRVVVSAIWAHLPDNWAFKFPCMEGYARLESCEQTRASDLMVAGRACLHGAFCLIYRIHLLVRKLAFGKGGDSVPEPLKVSSQKRRKPIRCLHAQQCGRRCQVFFFFLLLK